MSSPLVNGLWGGFNFVVGVILLRTGRFDTTKLVAMATVGIGGILMAIMLANAFGQVFAAAAH
jgi:hypothetical protein